MNGLPQQEPLFQVLNLCAAKQACAAMCLGLLLEGLPLEMDHCSKVRVMGTSRWGVKRVVCNTQFYALLGVMYVIQ